VGGGIAMSFEDNVMDDNCLILSGVYYFRYYLFFVFYLYLLFFYFDTGSLSFSGCSAPKGNLIYLFGMDLGRIVTKKSFNYGYSLLEGNDLVGKNEDNNNEVHLRFYLCPLRFPNTDSSSERIFDCDDGCVEYYV
jgi:hypothetical protein